MDTIRDIPLADRERQGFADDAVQPLRGYAEEFQPVSFDPAPKSEDILFPSGELAPPPVEKLAPAKETGVSRAMGSTGLGELLAEDVSEEPGFKLHDTASVTEEVASGEGVTSVDISSRHRAPGGKAPKSQPDKGEKAEPERTTEVPPKEEAAFSGGGAGEPPDRGPRDAGGEGDPERDWQWRRYELETLTPFVEEYQPQEDAEMDEATRDAAKRVLWQVDNMIGSGEGEDTASTQPDLPVITSDIPTEDEILEMLAAAKQSKQNDVGRRDIPEELSDEAPALLLGGVYAVGGSTEKEFPASEENSRVPLLVSCRYDPALDTPPGHGRATVSLYSYRGTSERQGSCIVSIETRPSEEDDELAVTDASVRRQLRGGDVREYIPSSREIAELRKVLAACQDIDERR